ncbi:unnamed protein product, partial [Ectocarpus sp. 12 AP-2014]
GEGEEEEVVSLRLVGLGVQLHSKSYGARFSFSMQDLDLEDRLQESSKITKAARSFVPDGAADVVAVGEEEGEEPKARDEVGVPSPPNSLPPTRDGGGSGGSGGDEDGEQPAAGDMATTRPRLCLWQRRVGGNGGWTATGGSGG